MEYSSENEKKELINAQVDVKLDSFEGSVRKEVDKIIDNHIAKPHGSDNYNPLSKNYLLLESKTKNKRIHS